MFSFLKGGNYSHIHRQIYIFYVIVDKNYMGENYHSIRLSYLLEDSWARKSFSFVIASKVW